MLCCDSIDHRNIFMMSYKEAADILRCLMRNLVSARGSGKPMTELRQRLAIQKAIDELESK